MNKTVRFITRTAILLALTLIFQSLRLLIPMPQLVNQYVTGSLVNLCLIVAAVMVGIKGGLVIAIATPFVAFLQGFMKFPVMIPLIALGNIALVVAVGVLYKKDPILSVIAGAVVKFIVLFLAVVKIGVPFLLNSIPDAAKGVLSVQFSWPQLATATIGGILALGVASVLKKVVKD